MRIRLSGLICAALLASAAEAKELQAGAASVELHAPDGMVKPFTRLLLESTAFPTTKIVKCADVAFLRTNMSFILLGSITSLTVATVSGLKS